MKGRKADDERQDPHVDIEIALCAWFTQSLQSFGAKSFVRILRIGKGKTGDGVGS